MQIDRLRTMLDAPAEAETWLRPLGFADVRTGHTNLVRLASAGVPLDLLGTLCAQFEAVAPKLADPDMALNNLERYLLACRSPLAAAALFERDPEAMEPLLLLFSASQSLSDLLCQDPESYDLLRMTAGRAVSRDVLVDELVADVRALSSEEEVMAALRRFKRRETLRIAYGDIVKGHSVAKVTRQISYVADAAVEAALDFATRQVCEKEKRRNGRTAEPPRLVVLALGKLGGRELNYSSDIDLVMLYQEPAGESGGARDESSEYAQRLARETIRLLAEPTDLGFAYRVDMRLRPDGQQGPLCTRVENALVYYDTRGRTWERQAYVKARAIAGDIELGKEYLNQLKPWIYRRYLSRADIAGIKSLKRRIEKTAEDAGVATRNVKTGRGGIRDIEFVIQFLQLLNGGADPRLRTGNTLIAIERLEEAGLLTHQERTILADNYEFLRKVEHRLQIMFDLQTHDLPAADAELIKLARRLDYPAMPSPLDAFRKDYADRTAVNRKILDHLLHDAFPEDGKTEAEIDLVNDPDPSPQLVERVLGQYGFRDVRAAYDNIMSLARESIPFLSTRRCRLFLASISPNLLKAVARTPDPDATLVSLSRVSDSLGGKSALWELFSANRATLELYVRLCAACPYLAGILTSNPGMIDELTDSLLVEKLPDLSRLEASLKELTRGAAEDLEPILRSFKSAQHLRVGVRDIVGKDDIRDTQSALADVAEACLKEIAAAETVKLTEKLGQPTIGPLSEDAERENAMWMPEASRVGGDCELIVLALGKLGGREPNYHSDLDLVFLYEADGQTVARRGRSGSTSNSHFFSELGQRIIKAASQFGPAGRLYEVDPRLRPTGRSGALAMPLPVFVRYFRAGEGQLWERLALCKARVIVGSPAAAERAMAAVSDSIYCRSWRPEDAGEILEMRGRLEESASSQNLKRGAGGTMDVEFIVGMLQLKYGKELPELRVPRTLDGLGAMEMIGRVDFGDAAFLAHSYRFQRSIEARIRLMDAAGRHEFPDDPRERAKLAYLLGYADPEKLAREVEDTRRETRDRFKKIFAAAEE